MRAAEFFSNFEAAFNAQALPANLKRMGGKTPKWSVPIGTGSLQFKLSTDFKGAGLLSALLWPGEHRFEVRWILGRGKERHESIVSLFQYTTPAESEAFTEILRGAVRKYLDAGGPDPYGTLLDYLTSDLAIPKPNIHKFYYFFDAVDAQRWGAWYGSILAPWCSRFEQSPESNDDWAWRVLWPHLKRRQSAD